MKRADLPVVVGIDGSDAAINAVLWAIDEAVVRDVRLRLVAAVPLSDLRGSSDTRGPESQYAETALRAATAAALAAGKPVKVETAIEPANPQDLLIDESHSAAMICMGSVGINRFAANVLGSTAQAVANGAHCPVAIIRSRARSSGPTDHPSAHQSWVVAAINELSDCDDVLELGFAEAALRNTGLIAVVMPWWTEDAERNTLMDATIDNWSARHPGVPVQTWIASRSLAEFIADSEDSVQLVVVGRADAHQVSRLVGPVDGLSRFDHNECSVLVTRH